MKEFYFKLLFLKFWNIYHLIYGVKRFIFALENSLTIFWNFGITYYYYYFKLSFSENIFLFYSFKPSNIWMRIFYDAVNSDKLFILSLDYYFYSYNYSFSFSNYYILNDFLSFSIFKLFISFLYYSNYSYNYSFYFSNSLLSFSYWLFVFIDSYKSSFNDSYLSSDYKSYLFNYFLKSSFSASKSFSTQIRWSCNSFFSSTTLLNSSKFLLSFHFSSFFLN